MTYTLDNGKSVKIPDTEITELMSSLNLTKDQAIELWLDDNEYTTCDVVDELTKKAKENGVKIVGSATKKERKPRAKSEKVDTEKEMLINFLAENLGEIVQNVQITNKSKIVEFELNGQSYKLDLIRKRPKKDT